MRWISAALGKAASAPDAAKALGAKVEAARLAIAAETRSSFLMNCTLGFETFHRPVGSRRRHDRPVIGRVRAGLTACAPWERVNRWSSNALPCTRRVQRAPRPARESASVT